MQAETSTPSLLPESYWNMFADAAKTASIRHPIETLVILAGFGLLLVWIIVATRSHTQIEKEKIKYDYRGKRDKARLKYLSKQEKLTSKPTDGEKK